jgi:hypothetical protein
MTDQFSSQKNPMATLARHLQSRRESLPLCLILFNLSPVPQIYTRNSADVSAANGMKEQTSEYTAEVNLDPGFLQLQAFSSSQLPSSAVDDSMR